MDSATTVWTRTLDALELQMTRATFDQHLRGSQVDPQSNGTLIVTVTNVHSVAWLDTRLRPAIERTLQQVAGEPVPVTFVADGSLPVSAAAEPVVAQTDAGAVQQAQLDALFEVLARIEDPQARAVIAGQIRDLGGEPPADQAATSEVWTPPEVDTSTRWFPVPEYANRFWAPLLGRVAFRAWMIVRQRDTRPAKLKRRDEWTPKQRFTAPEIARMVPCGRQSITGAWRRCPDDHPDAVLRKPRRIIPQDADEPTLASYRRQPGALETLETEGLALISTQGTRRHKTYTVQVRLVLPVLSPSQVVRLDEDLRVAHDRWLRDMSIEVEAFY